MSSHLRLIGHCDLRDFPHSEYTRSELEESSLWYHDFNDFSSTRIATNASGPTFEVECHEFHHLFERDYLEPSRSAEEAAFMYRGDVGLSELDATAIPRVKLYFGIPSDPEAFEQIFSRKPSAFDESDANRLRAKMTSLNSSKTSVINSQYFTYRELTNAIKSTAADGGVFILISHAERCRSPSGLYTLGIPLASEAPSNGPLAGSIHEAIEGSCNGSVIVSLSEVWSHVCCNYFFANLIR